MAKSDDSDSIILASSDDTIAEATRSSSYCSWCRMPRPLFTDPSWNFWLFATLFSLNRAAATMWLSLATILLDTKEDGCLAMAVFNVACLICLLFVAPALANIWNPRQLMILGASLFALSNWTWVAAVSSEGATRTTAAMFTAILGGFGAGCIWPPWGLYMQCATDQIQEKKQWIRREKITAGLNTKFALPYIFTELGCSLFALLLDVRTAKGLAMREWVSVIYAVIATITAACYIFTSNLERPVVSQRLQGEKVTLGDVFCRKISVTISLWPNACLWFFGTTTIAFSIGAAYINGVVNWQVKEAFTDGAIGYFDSLLTLVAALVAIACGMLVAKEDRRDSASSLKSKSPDADEGKGQVLGLLVGSIGLGLVGVFGLSVTLAGYELRNVSYWLLVPYIFQGIGRGAYESVNKAVFFDHFPNQLEAAFSNQMSIYLVVSGLFFFLGAFANISVSESIRCSILLSFAVLIVPMYLVGKWLHGKRKIKDQL